MTKTLVCTFFNKIDH